MKKDFIRNGFGIGAVIFALAAVIALPLRTVQFFTVLEDGTGFYSETDFGVYLLFGVLAVSILALLFIGVSKRKKLSFSTDEIKSPGCGILALTAAVGVILDAVNCFGACLRFNSSLGISTAAYEETSPVQFLILSAEGILAILTALFFVIIGISLLTGKSSSKSCRYLALVPVFWSVVRMVFRYTRTISYIRVSDLLFEMLMLVFMIAFFFAFAQANSKINAKNIEWKVASYGLCTALLALVCFVPRFIVILSGNAEHLYSYSTAEYCDFAISLFIIGTVFTRISSRQPEITPVSEESDVS